jgi:hypothetical protein
MEEFENPLAYIAAIREEAQEFGICKIVPPPQWRPPFQLANTKFKFATRLQTTSRLFRRRNRNTFFTTTLHLHLQSEGKLNGAACPAPAALLPLPPTRGVPRFGPGQVANPERI